MVGSGPKRADPLDRCAPDGLPASRDRRAGRRLRGVKLTSGGLRAVRAAAPDYAAGLRCLGLDSHLLIAVAVRPGVPGRPGGCLDMWRWAGLAASRRSAAAPDPHELVDLAASLGHVVAGKHTGLPKLGPGGVAGRYPRSRVGMEACVETRLAA